MKIDMHCHVKEGSIDSKVGVEEYITILKKHGFQGMVITDHDTYNGYRYWKENIKGKKHTDFVVLKGIEYDTRDAGHILVIMPEGVKMRLLEMRGMPLALLIDLVHRNGGVLGPAHPCGEKYMSFTNARRYYLFLTYSAFWIKLQGKTAKKKFRRSGRRDFTLYISGRFFYNKRQQDGR